MRPVLFHWRGRDVRSYPAFLYIGAVAGIAVGNLVANSMELNGARVYVAMLVLLVPALAGARVASVFADWSDYRTSPEQMWRRSDGGQAMYGGLVAVPVSLPLLAVLRVPFWAFWDVATFTILTGMAFTRIGCLLTGCCAGRPTWSRVGIVSADTNGVWARRYPTQLLEAATACVLLAAATAVLGGRLPGGSAFAICLGTYAVARVFLQSLRASERRVGRLPALRAASVAIDAAVAVAFLPRIL